MRPTSNKNNNRPDTGEGAAPGKKSSYQLPPNVKAVRDALRGKPSSPQTSKESITIRDDIFPLSKAHQEAAKKPVIGRLCPGKGIYLGEWTPAGQVSKTFNLFAAPENLAGGQMDFNQAAQKVRALKNWHGHGGFDQVKRATEEESLLEALASGSYKGEWFIPPATLLKDYLMKHRKQGALAESLGPVKKINDSFHSCSRSAYIEQYLVHLNLVSGQETAYSRWEDRANVRLMRAEPV